MNKKLAILAVVAVIAALISFGGPALAATLVVDDDGVECPSPYSATIQAAVNAASPGDTILVCPGTYTEQVNVNKSVTVVEGFETQQTPTTFGVGNDVIMVYDADGVVVRNNKVKGAGPYIF